MGEGGRVGKRARMEFAPSMGLLQGEGLVGWWIDLTGEEVVCGDLKEAGWTVPNGSGPMVRVEAWPCPDNVSSALSMGRLVSFETSVRGCPDQCDVGLGRVSVTNFERWLGNAASCEISKGGFKIRDDHRGG